MAGKAIKALEEVETMSLQHDRMIQPKAPPQSLTLATPSGNKRRINYGKSPARRMQGKPTIRSQMVSPVSLSVTPSMNNYRMIGLKAVLNSADS